MHGTAGVEEWSGMGFHPALVALQADNAGAKLAGVTGEIAFMQFIKTRTILRVHKRLAVSVLAPVG